MSRREPDAVTFEPYGDSAVMISFDAPEATLRRAAAARCHVALVANRPPVVTEIVAGLESQLVRYDPQATTHEHLVHDVTLILALPQDEDAPAGVARRFEIPVWVDPSTAPDLEEVAQECGVSTDAFLDTFFSSPFTISLLAAAMAPMMDGHRTATGIRRRAQPRTDVAPGSIMVAGTNAIIQPFPGPTGWRVIGRTPHTIVDIRQSPPTSFGPGDAVTFVRIGSHQAALLEGTFLREVGATR